MANVAAIGAELVVRAAAAPITLGLRWARYRQDRGQSGVPLVPWSLSLASKVALDDFFLLSEVASATLVSLSHRSRLKREIADSLAFYEAHGWLDEPAAYHDTPPPLRDEKVSTVDSLIGFHRHLRWDSGYAPHPGEPGGERWEAHDANHTAHAWLFEHPGGPRPWVVCVPGYRMGHHVVDFAGFRIRWLFGALGLNVAVPVMPLHGPRREGRRGGDGFLSGDFVDTVHAQTQAVWDIRRLLTWLRRHEAPAIAAYGVSLGGYTAALLASLEPDLDCVIAGIPASDFVGLVEGHVPRVAVDVAARIGFPFDDLRRMLRVASPLAIAPRVPRERRFLYAATHDALAVPAQARDLWRHWERPRIEWYEGSHVSFLWEAKVKGLLREALGAAGMIVPGLASESVRP